MTTLIIFLVMLFLAPIMGNAGGIQPPTQKEWRAAKTCSQAVDLATRQATIDMHEIGVPLTKKQIRPVMLKKLQSLPNSPCYQSKHSAKSGSRSQN